MKDIILTNIQRFSLHDGPGIRTTVFLKGCSLRCPWCSNPENMVLSIQTYIKDDIKRTYGKHYDCSTLYTELLKDKPFYGGTLADYHIISACDIDYLPGGVTFSGGECLLQMETLEPLLIKLHEEHIHTAVETALFVPPSFLQIAIQYIDLFYVDVKILDEENCRLILGGDLKLYLSNLYELFKTEKPVIVRIPVIGGYTEDEQNRKKVAELIARNKVLKVELIKEHNLGISKWESLAKCNDGYKIPDYHGVTDELMEQYKKELEKAVQGAIPIEICKI